MIKTVIADDQTLLAEGIKSMLTTAKDIEVVYIAGNGAEAVDFVKKEDVDVVLMDIRMPDMNGVIATREIKKCKPDVKVIILTTFDDSEYILDAMNFGANGYLLKDISANALISAVRNAVEGDTILPSKIAMKIAMAAKTVTNDREIKLKKAFNFSDREVDIAMMLYENFTNRQITSALGLNEGTTRNYISGIYVKMAVGSRQEAIEKMQSVLQA